MAGLKQPLPETAACRSEALEHLWLSAPGHRPGQTDGKMYRTDEYFKSR